jgi:hypothetical protein
MYRLCEGYASGAVSAATFQSMQRRYQSTMMGLIAIEQLTGPVTASQALLTTSASAQAGASAGDAATSKAQERVDTTAQSLLSAQTKSEEEQAKYATASKKLDVTRKQLAAEQAKTPMNAPAVADQTAQVETLQQDFAAARRERDAAQRALKVAEDAARAAAQDLRSAQARVSADASGSGKLGDVAGAIAASNDALTQGVVDIVREINVSYLRDSCVSFSADLLKDPELIKTLQALGTSDTDSKVSPTPMVKTLIETCTVILRDEGARLTRTLAAVKGRPSGAPANTSAQPAGTGEGKK